jgi:hypothetical protein
MSTGSSGGSGSATSTTTGISELPEWARGYAKDTLYQASQLTDINQNPYQTYDQSRIAGFSPLQQQAQQGAANMGVSAATGTAQDMAQAAGTAALGTQYNKSNYGNTFNAPSQLGYNAAQSNYNPGLQNYQMGPAQQVGSQQFTNQGTAQAYMNPYLQASLAPQMQMLNEQQGMQQQANQGQAVQAGAFGGSRMGIQNAQQNQANQLAMSNLVGQGFNTAYGQAQQQFNADQSRSLAAQQANQQAGLTVGSQNLAANLGVQQLGTQTGLQQSLANQQAQNQAAQFGAGQNLSAANMGAQYGQAANQLNEQSSQYGAGLGLQGLQTGLQAAGQLGTLGQNEYSQNMGINQLQNATGAQQQAQVQQGLTQSYQDFLNQKNFPYQQLSYMSDMVRGLPLGQSSTSQIYQAPPSALQSAGALGLGAYGLKQAGIMAKGGKVKGYAGGGSISPMDNPNVMTAAVSKLTEPQLQKIIQAPASAAEKQAAQLELATRASEKRGLAGAYNSIPYSQQAQSPQLPQLPQIQAAKGGIMHFGVGGGAQSANDGDAGDAEAQAQEAQAQEAQEAQEVAQDEQSQGAVDTSDPTTKSIANVGLQALYRDRDRAVPDIPAMNDPNSGVGSYMSTIRQLAGPDPYPEIKSQIANMANQSQQALQQGKGIAALHAMGALLQGPNFMRALGGAGSAFADSYGQAMQAHRQAQNAQMQMSINVANGQRAENLGLAKDAIGSFQAANANKIAMFKAEGERDQRLARSAASLARSVAPPKPVAPVKPTDSQLASAAFLKAAQNPTDKQAQQEAATWRQTLNLTHPAVAAAGVTAAAANERNANDLGVRLQALSGIAQDKADAEAEKYGLSSEYRKLPVEKRPAALETYRTKVYQQHMINNMPAPAPYRPGAAPAAPAAPAKPATAAPGANITLPPAALSQLKEGQVTTFTNGQAWTIKNGAPVQVK